MGGGSGVLPGFFLHFGPFFSFFLYITDNFSNFFDTTMLNSGKAGRATEFVPANDCSRNACFPSRDICTLTPGQLAEPTTILSSEKSEHQETQKFNTFKVRKRHKVCCFKQDAYAYQLVCKLSCE